MARVSKVGQSGTGGASRAEPALPWTTSLMDMTRSPVTVIRLPDSDGTVPPCPGCLASVNIVRHG
ncbi:hypothetical protein Xph01_38810 [Micromonospora phaseoli]|nr:hypothetical protein Xph01_38810 [Micromonospora phaseoli]